LPPPRYDRAIHIFAWHPPCVDVDALWSGTLASLGSGAVLAWRGRAENASAAAPLNAPAHWFFGDESLRQDDASWRHTATGVATHQISSVLWAALHQLLIIRR
jgi:hypothetical protein